MLGGVPDVEGLWLACGFSGHGVMHAPATGRILADLILNGRCDAIDWSALCFDRLRTGALLHETAVF
jgi:sarcosine oxidase subunit beta